MVAPVPAYLGQGIELRIGDGAGPEVFTEIPGCASFGGPGDTSDTVDVTSHSSPNRYRQFIRGLKDGGELTCDVYWLFDDPAQIALEAAKGSDGYPPIHDLFTTDDLGGWDKIVSTTVFGPDGAFTKAFQAAKG